MIETLYTFNGIPWLWIYNIDYRLWNFKVCQTTSDLNSFVTFSNRLLKRLQKKGNKHRSTILNKILVKHLTDFNIFADTATNFIKLFLLPWIRTIHTHVCLLHSLFLWVFLLFCLFVCLFVCLLVWYLVIIASVSSIFLSMYLFMIMFLWVGILYYNVTII